jgi:hypothetical protein
MSELKPGDRVKALGPGPYKGKKGTLREVKMSVVQFWVELDLDYGGILTEFREGDLVKCS